MDTPVSDRVSALASEMSAIKGQIGALASLIERLVPPPQSSSEVPPQTTLRPLRREEVVMATALNREEASRELEYEPSSRRATIWSNIGGSASQRA